MMLINSFSNQNLKKTLRYPLKYRMKLKIWSQEQPVRKCNSLQWTFMNRHRKLL